MNDEYRPGCNAEGYADPTATEAIENITRAEQAANRRAGLVLRILRDLFALGGFQVLEPVRLRDKKTGRVYEEKR